MNDSSTRKGRTKQKGWRIDAAIADEFTAFCEARGWNANRQVEDALVMWLAAKKGAIPDEGDVIRRRKV